MKKYQNYKPTLIPWMDKIPSHWEERRNKFLFRRSKNLVGPDFEKYPVLSLTLQGVIRRDMDNPMGKMPATFADYQKIDSDTLLFCLFDYDVTPRTVGIVTEEGIVSPAYTSIYKVEKKLDLRYYYYWFLFLDDKKMLLSYVKNLRNSIGYDEFSNLLTAKPPFEEQISIANFLDAQNEKINRFITKKQKLIEILNEQKQSVINDILNERNGSISIEKLKYCVEKVGSGVTPSGGATSYVEKGIPLLRSQNIHNDGLKLQEVAFIPEEVHNSMSNSKVKAGDVLLNITGGSLGRCFYATETLGEANVNQHVSIIRPKKKKITTEYLHLLLLSELGQKQIWEEQTGSGREGLTGEAIKNFKFPVPNISEQTKIVELVGREWAKTSQAIMKIEREIELIKDYKQSLIAEAVTGKIDVRSKTKSSSYITEELPLSVAAEL